MVWGLYRVCPLFGFVVSSAAVCLACGARDGVPGGDLSEAGAGGAVAELAPCSGLLPDSVPNADCGTLQYRLCPLDAPAPNGCSLGFRATEPQVWCCGGYVPPAGCNLAAESVRLQLCRPEQAELISCPGAQAPQPFAGCTGPTGQDSQQVTGSAWCCP